MKEFFSNPNLNAVIIFIVLCVFISILYSIAFKTMRDRIATQKRLIELKDEQIEYQKQHIDKLKWIIEEYENMVDDLMTTKGNSGGIE